MQASPISEDVFDALGSPVRRRLLEMLQERPRAVGELAALLPISRPAVSKHLKVLEDAALARHRVRGTQHLFEVNPEGLESARQWLESFWDEALSRFKLAAENLEEDGQ